ncbi:uncharacterized protein LOC117900684 [Drosophila subobscura]|uniref:uncharacterized protein LOC117900684 n=1 Tax=Drosophila subobscura TaxID=7241 RepID=UPI00155AB63B|nr:uncharacterized protein LOC117900684 [Drosophila subobscura]
MNPKPMKLKKSASNDSFLSTNRKTQQLSVTLGDVLKEAEGAPAEAITQTDLASVQEEAQDPYQKEDAEEQLNKFWIAISGYQLDRAFSVYRFFNDIGTIKSKGFTQTNVMYLKYRTTVDCQIALSYDGQKIGYGGDIRVSVKPENPMALLAFLGAIEKMDADTVDSGPLEADAVSPKDFKASCFIEMESPRQKEEQEQAIKKTVKQQQVTEKKEEQLQEQPEEVKVEPPVNVFPPKNAGLIQWLKEKISSLFFFY